MDILEIVITVVAVLGVILVAALAILPPLIEAEAWSSAPHRSATPASSVGRPTSRPGSRRRRSSRPLVLAQGAGVGPVR